MTYFIRDFDADQPTDPNLSASRRFRVTWDSRMRKKLVRLLNEFEFVDVRTAVSRLTVQMHLIFAFS